MAKEAIVILAEGFEEIEAATPIDVLRRAGVTLVVAGLGGTTVKGAHGLTYIADIRLEQVEGTPDAVILPGGMPGSKHLGASEAVKVLVQNVNKAGGVVAAICAAPAFALAKFGILDGKTATCYPGCEGDFAESTTVSEDRVVVDGNLVTSRGPGTSMAFALALVEILVGQEKADELRTGMLIQ